MKAQIFISITLFLLASFKLSSQNDPPCDYVPLEFSEISPIWTYLCIDSTFIGHTDTSEGTGEFVQYYYDGMGQLFFDGGSFIYDNYLYSITKIIYDFDLSGYYIEKIDLESGKSVWKIRTDLRHVDNREKALNFEVTEDQFNMYGVRSFWDEIDLKFLTFETGLVPGYFFKRSYDLESGSLISHYTPVDTDTMAMKLQSNIFRNFLYPINDSLYEYFERDARIDNGYFITRAIIDGKGYQISPFDTVITGSYNDLNFSETFFESSNQFTKDEIGNYYYLEQFLPDDNSELLIQSKITKYNSSFEIINSWDFSNLALETYGVFSISNILDDKIILKGCLQENPDLFCEIYFIILDSKLNFITSFEAKHKESFIRFFAHKPEAFSDDERLLGIDRQLLEDEFSYLNVYIQNDNGKMDSVRRLTIDEFNWVGEPEKFFVLEDGDFIVKIPHSCYVDGRKNSWHPEWFRFKAEDFDLVTSINEPEILQSQLQLSPNPTTDEINLELEPPLTGQLYLYNNQGLLMKTVEIKNEQIKKINISDFPTGTYHIKFISKSGGVFENLVIKI